MFGVQAKNVGNIEGTNKKKEEEREEFDEKVANVNVSFH